MRGRVGYFVHGGAIDKETVARFGCVWDTLGNCIECRSPANGSPGTMMVAYDLITAIVFPHHKNSAATWVRFLIAASKPRAEWTFLLKPRTLES